MGKIKKSSKIKKFLNFIYVCGFPWIVILLNDNPIGAILALIMQVSLIGWIPAVVWARRVLKEGEEKEEKITIDD